MNISPVAARAARSVPSKRNPTAKATTSMTTNVRTLRTTSDSVRPISTEPWCIGNERSRSMMPLLRSSATPTPVKAELNSTVWAKMPGITYCT